MVDIWRATRLDTLTCLPYKLRFLIETLEKNNVDFSTCADIGSGARLITKLLVKRYRHKQFTRFEREEDYYSLLKSLKKTKVRNLSSIFLWM